MGPSNYQKFINLVSNNPKFITKLCNEKEIQQFTNTLHSFILFFNRFFNFETFWELLLESQYSNYLIQLIFKYPNNSGLLKEETISKIYALIKSNEDFDILISLWKKYRKCFIIYN